VSADLRLAGIDVAEALDAIEAFDRQIGQSDHVGDVAQAVLLVGTAVVFAIRELGLRLEAMSE
jgi:hypothetical protein